MKMIMASAMLAAAALSSAPAAAVIVDGTMAVSLVGISSDTASIGVGTTFTNTLFSVVGSATGDLAGVNGVNLTVSPLTASVGEAFSFTSAFGDFAGTVQTAFAQGGENNRTVIAFVLGVFSPSGTLSGFDVGPASTTFSFTQTGIEGATSGSFSFSSPPNTAPSVPEPASWAMLVAGFGLVGAALRRRNVGARIISA